MALPSARVGWELLNEVRNTLGAHWARVAMCTPALGIRLSTPDVARHLVDAHLHTGVNGADQHVDLVALHQAVGVLDALGRVGFVIDLEELDLAPAQLAALFIQGHAEAVFDGHAQLREVAGVGQHEAHAQLVGLGAHDLRQQQAGRGGADHGGTAGEDKTAGGHGESPRVVGMAFTVGAVPAECDTGLPVL